ncbi:MAG TPA: 1,4-dihydroxy-2-naphthoate octaprenyltransferase [Bdellovibrionota bacterium]|nr:1,4-dihydroxy-2-naphthoate octaprenyltransferase [Bdellovibrionota bacterium]
MTGPGRYWRAVRPFSLPASVVPVFLGSVLGVSELGFSSFHPAAFILTLMGVVALHCVGNLVNDYFDDRKGVDTGPYGSRGSLATKEMTPAGVRRLIAIFLVIASACGIVLTFTRGTFVPLLGGVGVLLAFTYTAYPIHLKYRGVGDLVIVLGFGPLVVLGSNMVQTQHFSWKSVFIALPITFLVDAILHANNTRDLTIDRQNRIRTWAGILGPSGARTFYSLLLIGAYVSVATLVSVSVLTPVALVTFLTIPVAWKLHRMMDRQEQIEAAAFAFIDAKTAQLHLVFGLLLSASLIPPVLIR